ncbi:MAG: SUMF1/EgtB/PvdO family nonheme iron enzyme [Cyanobacteria bacterium J06642_2]
MGQHWAIAIGIDSYKFLTPLDYARRDAVEMKAFFEELNFDFTYFFAEDAAPIPQDWGDPFDSSPTIGNLRYFFRQRFNEAFLEPQDNLWFFFAGHGVRREQVDYLIPLDGSDDDDGVEGIDLGWITGRLRNSGAGNVILAVDACRRGTRGTGFGQMQEGVVTIYSCAPNQISSEIPALKQGAFTFALLEGLRGHSDCNTVRELDGYLQARVPQLCQEHKVRSQTPNTVPDPRQKLDLILFPHRANPVDIQTLKLEAYKAMGFDNYDLARTFFHRVLEAEHDFEVIQALGFMEKSMPMWDAATVDESDVQAVPDSEPVVPEDPDSVLEWALHLPPNTLQSVTFDVVIVDAEGNKASNRTERLRRGFVEDLGNGVLLEMVAIPGGCFQMGSPNGEGEDRERPRREVLVEPFAMGRYAVTQRQYQTLMNVNPSNFNGDQNPVEQVSWHDAKAFCDRLSELGDRQYRLPSEAEWEYACRAGTTTPFHLGATITPDLANYDANKIYGSGPKGKYRERTTPVGTFGVANEFGLYDMHGNVGEWCEDVWHENYAGASPREPLWIEGGDSSYRMVRGGSWLGNPEHCRSAYRNRFRPVVEIDIIGFRVVCCSAWNS